MVKHNKTHYIPDEVFEPVIEEPEVSAKWEHFNPEFVGTQVQTLNLELLDQQMRDFRNIYNEARIGQSGGSVIIRTEHPICIFTIGDVHFGSVFCEHELFFAQMEKIKQTPGAYIVWLSNLIDNAIPSQYPNNMLNNSIPPDKQVVRMRKLMEELNAMGKILGAVTSPCHEGWTWKHTGQDINALIFGFEGRKFPVLDNGSVLKVAVGIGEDYHIYNVALYHQVGPFESNFNETHALRQMNRLNLQMNADVVVGAHKHCAAAQLTYEGVGKNVIPVAYIRSGTYKGIGDTPDQFSIGRYGATGEPSGQSFILWPGERRIAVNLEFETGLMVYNAALTSNR